MTNEEWKMQHKTVNMLRDQVYASNMSNNDKDMFDLLLCAYFQHCNTTHGENAVVQFAEDAKKRGYIQNA